MGRKLLFKGLLVNSLLFVMIAICSLSLSEAGNVNIDLSTTVAPESCIDLAVIKFKELVEKESNNEITINLFRSGQLYDPKAEIEAIYKGVLPMATLHMSYVGARSPILEFIGGLGAKGCWSSTEHYWRFLDSSRTRSIIEEEFNANLNSKVLALLSYGTGVVGNRVKPIHRLEDFKGLKIRAAGTSEAVYFNAVGAVPTEMSAAEVYMALQRGTIDGASSGPERFYKSKWYEVATYITQDYSLPDVSLWLAINSKFWDKLSTQHQDILSRAALDVEQWTRNYSKEQNEKSYKDLQKVVKEVYLMPKTEVDRIATIVRPVMFESLAKRAGKNSAEKVWNELLSTDHD